MGSGISGAEAPSVIKGTAVKYHLDPSLCSFERSKGEYGFTFVATLIIHDFRKRSYKKMMFVRII